MNYGKVEEPSSSRSRYPSTARYDATSAILTAILSKSDRAPTSRTVNARPIASDESAFERLQGAEELAVKAARIHSFGPPDVVVVEDVPMPSPGPNEILVRVMAAGVAPWDAIIREGKSKVSPQPPLTLGSDFSGVVGKVGPGVTVLAPADEVYGVTNPQFCGAQAEFAVATSGMIARKPQSLNHVEAASAPVIAVTAWQMLFQYAQAMRGKTVMVVGAAGNVGAYAVQMAVDAGINVVAIAHLADE